MAEVLVQFDRPLADEVGNAYVVRVCGRVTGEGTWEGWIEFDPRDGGVTLRTPRETEQPNRADLEYWATGLTVAYLEGALERARHPQTPDLRPRPVATQPSYDRPAPSAPERSGTAEAVPVPRHAVLNPFEVYTQGEDVLRKVLSALDEGHLRNIIRTFGLVREDEMDLLAAHRSTLAEMIVAAVRKRLG